MAFTLTRQAKLLSLVLIVQAIGFYALSRDEDPPAALPLTEFPQRIGDWRMIQERIVEQELQDVLRADDVLSRQYASESRRRFADLFIAYFHSQRTGQAPHSPKNCLPGSGWVPSAADKLSVPVSGRALPIQVNRYIVEKGDEQSLVLYWYQSHSRVIASEYRAKIFLVLDSIRYNRSDTALVRVVIPILNKQAEPATQTAIDFVQSFFQSLSEFPQFQSL